MNNGVGTLASNAIGFIHGWGSKKKKGLHDFFGAIFCK
jgi:hypothetical protein